jgi:hypothetical protein
MSGPANLVPRQPSRAQRLARRRHRQSLTFMVLFTLVLLTGLAGVGPALGWWSWGPRPATQAVTACPARYAAAPTAVTLRVINATSRNGLAHAVAQELRARGFRVTELTNDLGHPVSQAAVVWHGPAGVTAARAVSAQFAGPVAQLDDQRDGSGVDLVLGDGYRGLASRPEALAAIAPRPAPSGCVPASAL